MQARVKKDYPTPTAQACSGREYVKYEWRPIPVGFEAEARRAEFLELQESPAPVKVAPAVTDDKPKPRKRKNYQEDGDV